MNALDPLLTVFKARDQQFTNIGGQTGFHANIVPGNMRSVRRIDVTLTILPRQSWLYMPFSLVVRKFDRMQTFFFFNKRGKAIRDEAHLIDPKFEKMLGNRIDEADSMTCEDVTWGGLQFHLYSSSERSRKWLANFINRCGDPGTIRHVGLIPREERAYIFMVPKVGVVPEQMTTMRDWLEETARAAGGGDGAAGDPTQTGDPAQTGDPTGAGEAPEGDPREGDS